ncbi:trehalose-phosphatase [Ornithinicoccus hortensis]|uniref:Trehalose 6-phosphate phosphatase n=1 Tax=Ornithinicoccus hortensis TaxID=82346 RepID=A0A542YP81_9MICO|nr:trehalose-phosphatase [Ornithinicoccus hortensis]TQL49859.1 trehalose 6-phosphatase [Ornithinicoccus hortensis]
MTAGRTDQARPPGPLGAPDQEPGRSPEQVVRPEAEPAEPSADGTGELLALARARPLLVGVDFDGTLAPLVDDPMQARPLPDSIALLHALADVEGVAVAVVSGRELAVLRQLSGAAEPLLLIGSHGAEASWEQDGAPDADALERLEALAHGLERIAGTHPGIRLERKPTALAMHTRGLPGDVAADAVQAASALARQHPGVHVTPGKDVLELAVTEAGKGPALLALAQRLGAGSVLYLGDDVTDERAFAHLAAHAADAGLTSRTVKVGPGTSEADLRVPDEPQVLALLSDLLEVLTRDRP